MDKINENNRQVVYQRLNSLMDVIDGRNLKQVKEYVDSLVDKYGIDADIRFDISLNWDELDTEVALYRPETDEEYWTRVKNEKEADIVKKERIAQEEKAELARLLEKYKDELSRS